MGKLGVGGVYKAAEEWHNSPNFTPGRMKLIKRIIIHATRGRAPLGVEAQATIGWFLNPASMASAHALITYDGRLIHFVSDYDTAWHAGEDNPDSLGLELEQPTPNTPFAPVQYHRAVEACRWWSAIHGIPLNREHIMGHEETSQGRRVGKTDPGGMWNWDSFMSFFT